MLDQVPSISSSRIKVLRQFTCSFEVKTYHAIHKNRAQTKTQQQHIVVVNKINQNFQYQFMNDLQKTAAAVLACLPCVIVEYSLNVQEIVPVWQVYHYTTISLRY